MDGKTELLAEKAQLLQRVAAIDALLAQYEAFERVFKQRAAAVLGKQPQDDDSSMPSNTKYVQGVSSDEGFASIRPESVADTYLRVLTLDEALDSKKSQRRKRSTSEEMRQFEEAVRQILEETPVPLNRKDMFQALQAKGISLPGASDDEKINALGSRLTRMEDVQNSKVGDSKGYWLRERPLREVSNRQIDDLA